MDDELQRRVLGIAMQHPLVVGGSVEDSWDGVAADHYVYALADYREVDRAIALARVFA